MLKYSTSHSFGDPFYQDYEKGKSGFWLTPVDQIRTVHPSRTDDDDVQRPIYLYVSVWNTVLYEFIAGFYNVFSVADHVAPLRISRQDLAADAVVTRSSPATWYN